MTKTSAEEELERFTGFKRLYRYKQEFMPDHFVYITKIGEDYQLVGSESTTNIDNFDKDLFLKMLMKEELVHYISSRWFNSIHELRTDGCSCGSWATPNSNLHTFDCSKNKKGTFYHE